MSPHPVTAWDRQEISEPFGAFRQTTCASTGGMPYFVQAGDPHNLKPMSYKITGLKKLVSNEGYAFNANLRCGNRKVAEISDDGWGGPTNVDFVSKEAEQAFRDACHTTYREQLKDFYLDVCEEHVEDLPIYMQRFDARDYSTPSERNSTNGEYFISVGDPVETMATLMCEEVIYS